MEVADGDDSVGTQYRYIVSNLFPYVLQCWRGDMGYSQKYNSNNGNYRKIGWNNKCGVNSTGDETDGGTWSEEEYSWVGGTCDIFDLDWVTDPEHPCTPGNCPYSYQDFRNANGFAKATTSTFSEVYFACTAAPTTTPAPTTTTTPAPTTTTTPAPSTTTTPARTTTTTAGQSVCPDLTINVPVTWAGAGYNKVLYSTYSKKLMRVNIMDKFGDGFVPCK